MATCTEIVGTARAVRFKIADTVAFSCDYARVTTLGIYDLEDVDTEGAE